MGLAIDIDQLGGADVRVALRGGELRVAQQFLDGSQVRPTLEQMRGKRMTQRVRADAQSHAALRHVPAQQPVDAAAGFRQRSFKPSVIP